MVLLKMHRARSDTYRGRSSNEIPLMPRKWFPPMKNKSALCSDAAMPPRCLVTAHVDVGGGEMPRHSLSIYNSTFKSARRLHYASLAGDSLIQARRATPPSGHSITVVDGHCSRHEPIEGMPLDEFLLYFSRETSAYE